MEDYDKKLFEFLEKQIKITNKRIDTLHGMIKIIVEAIGLDVKWHTRIN